MLDKTIKKWGPIFTLILLIAGEKGIKYRWTSYLLLFWIQCWMNFQINLWSEILLRAQLIAFSVTSELYGGGDKPTGNLVFVQMWPFLLRLRAKQLYNFSAFSREYIHWSNWDLPTSTHEPNHTVLDSITATVSAGYKIQQFSRPWHVRLFVRTSYMHISLSHSLTEYGIEVCGLERNPIQLDISRLLSKTVPIDDFCPVLTS